MSKQVLHLAPLTRKHDEIALRCGVFILNGAFDSPYLDTVNLNGDTLQRLAGSLYVPASNLVLKLRLPRHDDVLVEEERCFIG